MHENEIASVIVDVAFHIHQKLCPGLLESVYEAVMEHELSKRGLGAQSQVAIPVVWDNLRLEVGFRADIIVEGKVIIEVKSIADIDPLHRKQLLTYLKLTGCRLGVLINFKTALIKDGITRVVNGLED